MYYIIYGSINISRLSSHTLTQSWHGCYCVSDYQSHPVQVEPQLLSAQNRTETRWIQSANALVTKVILSRGLSRKKKARKHTTAIMSTCHLLTTFLSKDKHVLFTNSDAGQCQPPHDRRSVPTQPLGGIDFTWAVIHPTTCVVSLKN